MAEELPIRRTWAEIDLNALRHNLAAVRQQVADGVRVMAIVKANAYGHGVEQVVRALAPLVEAFGVANLAEALEVREHAPDSTVCLLGPALMEEVAEIVEHNFEPVISSFDEAQHFQRYADDDPVRVHVKLDTGMGRIGVWMQEAAEVVARIRNELPGIEIAGLSTHLPVADEDDAFTLTQLAEFHELIKRIRTPDMNDALVHALNSAGIIGFPGFAGDMVRPGLMLYGSAPRSEFQPKLQPVMTWKTRVTLVRDVGPGRSISYGRTFITDREMRIATLAVGYADGYQRQLSGRGAEVLIRGRRCAVLGRITMDQILADVTGLHEIEPGEEVVLVGRQDDGEILATELAQKAGTIAWHIFTSIGKRVERVYLNE